MIRTFQTIGVVAAVFCYALFSFAAAGGAAVATDGNLSYSEERSEFTGAIDDVQTRINANATGAGKTIIDVTVMPQLVLGEGAVSAGYDFGYSHPALAKANGYAAPVVTLVGGLGMAIMRLRRVLN